MLALNTQDSNSHLRVVLQPDAEISYLQTKNRANRQGYVAIVMYLRTKAPNTGSMEVKVEGEDTK
jgi:hypothetical protein